MGASGEAQTLSGRNQLPSRLFRHWVRRFRQAIRREPDLVQPLFLSWRFEVSFKSFNCSRCFYGMLLVSQPIIQFKAILRKCVNQTLFNKLSN